MYTYVCETPVKFATNLNFGEKKNDPIQISYKISYQVEKCV